MWELYACMQTFTFFKWVLEILNQFYSTFFVLKFWKKEKSHFGMGLSFYRMEIEEAVVFS